MTNPDQSALPETPDDSASFALPSFDAAWLAERWRLATERAPWLWPYGVLALVIALFMFPAWVTTSDLIIGGDTWLIHYPWFEFWRDKIGAGEFPFWNPYTFSGMPAFATPQAGYAYPPHWALTWMPSAMAINWLVGLHVVLAGITAAWCCGRLGADKDGQFLAGAVFALGGVIVGRLVAGHLSFLETLAWLPLATGLCITTDGRPRVWALALAVGMMALAAQPDILLFAAWWLPLWAAGSCLGLGWKPAAQAGARAVAGLALGLGLAAFFLLPVAEFHAISNRAGSLDWDFRTGISFPPWHLLELMHPEVFGEPSGSYWPGPGYEWHERLAYIGLIPLFAAFWARGRLAVLCWAGVAIAVAMAFGRHAFWYEVTNVIPGYDLFRIPSRHMELASLGLALLAGLGLSRVRGSSIAPFAVGAAGVLLLASLAATAWLPVAVRVLGGRGQDAQDGRLSSLANLAETPLLIGAAILAAVALVYMFFPALWTRRLLVVMAVLEVALVLQPYRLTSTDPQGIVDESAALQEHGRVAVMDNGALWANYGPVTGVVQPGGYTTLFSGAYMELLTGSNNPGVVVEASRGSEPILYLLGYGVWFDRDASVVTIVEPPPPEAWVARCAWPGGAIEARQPGFPLQSCVTLQSATQQDDTVEPGAASIVTESAGDLTLQADGPGWLVTTQPWYPGWSAKVDGEAVDVERVDGALVGVALEEGSHTVELSYLPAGLREGLAISALSLVAVVGLWYWERRSRRALTLPSPPGEGEGVRTAGSGSSR